VSEDARAAVAEVPLWYHTIDVGHGVVTPGHFDLRPVAGRLPWPEVRGLRCLDVGTFDGFLAFELERRGASEVVATDIASHEDWDWPHTMRRRGPEYMAEVAGSQTGRGFEVAKRLLGSAVEREIVSVYELSPERLGEFDVVVCGSLLLHLREPLRALEAIRSVCRGEFMSSEEIDARLTALQPRRPALRLDGLSELFQWFIPNAAAHRQMLEAAGFSVVRWTRPYSNPFGPGHPPRASGARGAAISAGRRLLTGGDGVPHQAVLART
jgi:tRNA (mo5U34)-methyltransferase